MIDEREIVQRGVERLAPYEPSFEGLLRRRDRKRRNQRIGVVLMVIAVLAVPVWLATRGGPVDHSTMPGGDGPTGTRGSGPATKPYVPMLDAQPTDFVLDLYTGDVTPVPDAILQSGGGPVDSGVSEWSYASYVATRGGSLLAYVGTAVDGTNQILVAGIDGSGIRQVTVDPGGALSPAWSPDGTDIAYVGFGQGTVRNLFVLDLATGVLSQVTTQGVVKWASPTFTPDGSALVFSAGSDTGPELWTVPVTGGQGSRLIGHGTHGLNDAASGALSPDGSLLSFMGSEIHGYGACRFVSNPDGSDWRAVGPCQGSTPAGTWSPDGTRIVSAADLNRVEVTNVTTGATTHVAQGHNAIWLDDRTLLIEV